MIIYFLITVLIIIIDQLSKILVSSSFSLGETKNMIKGFFNFTYIHNEGAAFGILQGARIFFVILTVFVFAFGYLYFKKNPPQSILEKLGLSFIAGGALGNLIDRSFYGYVKDFICVEFIDFPIFNIADCFVCIGAFLFILYIFINSKKEA